MWVMWDERNHRVFRGIERDAREIWSLVRFHVSHGASISKDFCNYPLDTILWAWFFVFPCILSSLFSQSRFRQRKKNTM